MGRRHPVDTPQRILIAHHLLLGDTLMLTPLIAKLHTLYPKAEILMMVAKPIAALYEKRPYSVYVLPWDPRDAESLQPLFDRQGFDLALIPGDNRYSWLAMAAGARWIVAFAGDRPAYKSWPVDELKPYPNQPMAWSDMVADLVTGPATGNYQPGDWLAPSHNPFTLPMMPYAVLHVGASSALKLWQAEKWRALAQKLSIRGLKVVWTGLRKEEKIVSECDPDRHYISYAGQLDLPQMWHLLSEAKILICPDTGIAHLGRIIGVPTITLFGPGSAVISGSGRFWQDARFRDVTIDPFPCRDQPYLFKRELTWVRRCARSTKECAIARCMEAISLEEVLREADSAMNLARPSERVPN